MAKISEEIVSLAAAMRMEVEVDDDLVIGNYFLARAMRPIALHTCKPRTFDRYRCHLEFSLIVIEMTLIT